MNLRFYVIVSGVNQDNGGRGGELDFLVLPQGFENFFELFELRVPNSGTPTQRLPKQWLCLRIPNQGKPQFPNSMGGQFSILALWNLCSESVGAWNFEILVKDSDTRVPSTIIVRIESLFTIFVLIPLCELCLNNDEGKAESIIKWGGWRGSILHGKKWRKIYDLFKISSLNR